MITVIVAHGCKHCDRMRRTINRLVSSSKKLIPFIYLDAEDMEAVDFALDNSISDIPACKIGNRIIQGEKFSEKDIEKAFAELLNE